MTILTRTMIGLLLLGLLTSCTSFDRTQAVGTRFEPMGIIEGETRFHYVTFADAVYPVDSPRAERIRVEWLEQWLKDNGQAGAPYRILSRETILRRKGLLGDIYDVHYHVAVSPIVVQ